MQILPWVVASIASMLLAALLAAWAWRRRGQRRRDTLPTEWELTARPVFSADERRVYRSLRDALPHHVLLSKLPLVRFCQPTEPSDTRYWYELLGSSHVSFAICSANGRVLAAIDLDSDRNGSRRMAQIKRAALSACRVRYLRCAVDELPSAAELQLLVPGAGIDNHAPQAAMPPPDRPPAPVAASEPAVSRRAPRPMLWQDTTVFQDSFFTPHEGLDAPGTEGFAPSGSHGTPASPPRAGRRQTPVDDDFEPTRNAVEDDDEDPRAGAAARRSRFFSGS